MTKKKETDIIFKLQRRLARLNQQKEEKEKEQLGKEENFTYWGGYNLGYIKGKIAEIENILDEISDES